MRIEAILTYAAAAMLGASPLVGEAPTPLELAARWCHGGEDAPRQPARGDGKHKTCAAPCHAADPRKRASSCCRKRG